VNNERRLLFPTSATNNSILGTSANVLAIGLKLSVLYAPRRTHRLFMSSSSTAHVSSLSAAAASSSASALLPTHDTRNTVVGGVLGVLAFILLVGVAFITLRARRRRQSNSEDGSAGPFQGTALWDKRHPAARIAPFGTPGMEGHYYRSELFSQLILSERLTSCACRTHRYEDSHPTARRCMGLHRPRGTVQPKWCLRSSTLSYVFQNKFLPEKI
jgi:hypothetical protein